MSTRRGIDFDEDSWSALVECARRRVDMVWSSSTQWTEWTKSDGSSVTDLDFQLDATLRSCLAEHLPEFAILSEESGHLRPTGQTVAGLALIDPVDGTESLNRGRTSWWVSVGLVNTSGRPLAGFIYQPATHSLHDSRRPRARPLRRELSIGLSPDRLRDSSTLEMRYAFEATGMRLVSTPHAAEKIAAVLEGRVVAAVYLPSTKSPRWHAWDVAAGVSLAEANELWLATLDGQRMCVDGNRTTFEEPWICAVDQDMWTWVSEIVQSSAVKK